MITIDEGMTAANIEKGELSRFVTAARRGAGVKGSVDVLLTGDKAIRRMNREFRKKDKATDVLSFPAGEYAGGHAGDLAVSLETAERQSKEHGHTLQTEVKVLLLHGVLHLAGHDHETDAGEMAALEMKLRGKLGLSSSLIARVESRPLAKKAAR